MRLLYRNKTCLQFNLKNIGIITKRQFLGCCRRPWSSCQRGTLSVLLTGTCHVRSWPWHNLHLRWRSYLFCWYPSTHPSNGWRRMAYRLSWRLHCRHTPNWNVKIKRFIMTSSSIGHTLEVPLGACFDFLVIWLVKIKKPMRKRALLCFFT